MRHLGTAAIVGLALVAAFTVAPPLRADAVDDDIKAMKVAEAGGKDDECIAKIESLRAGRDTRSFVPIRDMASSTHDKIACAAIHGIVDTWHEPEFFRWLVGKIDDKTLYDPKSGRPDVYMAVLDGVAGYTPDRVKQALKPLADCVARSMATNADFAERAIRAYGTVPDRFTVMQLLQWLDQSSAAGPAAAKENKERSRKAVLAALATLCGKELPDAASWKKWWDENGKTFKFPEVVRPGAPDAPAAAGGKPQPIGADPSGLTEFKDDKYGWSVKKPEGDDWTFFRPDYDVPRVGLRCGGDNDNRARAYFCVHDPSKFEPKDVKSFSDWVINNAFKEQLPVADRILPPETRTMMLNGVEWTVITAKGLAAGGKVNWGSMERRFYVAKLGAFILYVDAFVRLGTDPEDKDQLWNCVESVLLAPKK